MEGGGGGGGVVQVGEWKLYNFTELSDFSVIIFQPLMDNLESQTYEIFERDPIKYREYQRVGYLVSLNVCIISCNLLPFIP